MISCKSECIYNDRGECLKEDIVIGLSGCLSIIEKNNSVYAKVVEQYGHKEQKKKSRQELQELINELTESIVSPNEIVDAACIITEMADVLNMFESLKLMFGISNEDLHDIMEIKMKWTLDRIQKEKEKEKVEKL
jgi:hypothetical protein